MTRLIPLKEAINIIENKRLEIFRERLYEEGNCILLYPEEFCVKDIIIKTLKSKKLIDYIEYSTNFLSLTSKKYLSNKKKKEVLGLQLYGKKYQKEIKSVKGNLDVKFEKVYLSYRLAKQVTDADEQSWFQTEDYELYVTDNISNVLFENYNYLTRYNLGLNLTVMGDKKLNIIKYTDISVGYEDLMLCIQNGFKAIPPEYQLIVDYVLDQYEVHKKNLDSFIKNGIGGKFELDTNKVMLFFKELF